LVQINDGVLLVCWVGAGTRAARVPTVAENISTMRHELARRVAGQRAERGGSSSGRGRRDADDDDDEDDNDADDENDAIDEDEVALRKNACSCWIGMVQIAPALHPDEHLVEVIDPDEEEEDQILPTGVFEIDSPLHVADEQQILYWCQLALIMNHIHLL
jgi:hypothetical protein